MTQSAAGPWSGAQDGDGVDPAGSSTEVRLEADRCKQATERRPQGCSGVAGRQCARRGTATMWWSRAADDYSEEGRRHC
ncbi:hypothetical protein NDU88_000619 [Pleurodeles waltl]|uniref:Uncharacterized protein n=1 Tax=Pleurodeles waltl TaxID=8319 RepID=A0AAV7VWM1_PLEWA|nr:hypothetical protein NDU88_000619 [Pleurodeles waltl]